MRQIMLSAIKEEFVIKDDLFKIFNLLLFLTNYSSCLVLSNCDVLTS